MKSLNCLLIQNSSASRNSWLGLDFGSNNLIRSGSRSRWIRNLIIIREKPWHHTHTVIWGCSQIIEGCRTALRNSLILKRACFGTGNLSCDLSVISLTISSVKGTNCVCYWYRSRRNWTSHLKLQKIRTSHTSHLVTCLNFWLIWAKDPILSEVSGQQRCFTKNVNLKACGRWFVYFVKLYSLVLKSSKKITKI